jgi:putative phosphotransacetylase
MLQTFKPASECADCKLCNRGQQAAPGNGSPDIARVVREVIGRIRNGEDGLLEIPVGVSARHCHLNRDAMDILFGAGSELTPFRELYQPGAYAAEECVSVIGPRLRAIERVRILGPARDYNQVELARTDAIFLGLNPPVRDSGDLRGARRVTFVGPQGSLTVPAAIRAARHLHLRPIDVAEMGLAGRSAVRARVSGEKGLTFENVRLKIDAGYLPELHLDTDDANAADLACGGKAVIES